MLVYNGRCPHKEKEIQTQIRMREDGPMAMEAETGGMHHKPRVPGDRQKLEEAGRDGPLETPARAQPCPHLDLGLLACRL